MDTFLKRMQAIIVFLCGSGFGGYGSEANTQGVCVEHTSFEVGRQGTIKCRLDNFFFLSWYTKDDYDAQLSPFIHYSNGSTHGLDDQYDILPNGSLTIRNVSVNDAGSYVVTVSQGRRHPDKVFTVLVEVSAGTLATVTYFHMFLCYLLCCLW